MGNLNLFQHNRSNMKFAVKMLLFGAASVSAHKINQMSSLNECPCECISKEPLWTYYDYENEIYYDGEGCTECKVVANEACWTIQKAEEDKVMAAQLAADTKAAADAKMAHKERDAEVSITTAAEAAACAKKEADAEEAALERKDLAEIEAARKADALEHK